MSNIVSKGEMVSGKRDDECNKSSGKHGIDHKDYKVTKSVPKTNKK